MLIGLDCADLHLSSQDLRSEPSQPIARLTPLGCNCVGLVDKQPNDFTTLLEPQIVYLMETG